MTLSRSAKAGIAIGLLLAVIAIFRTNGHRTAQAFYRGLQAGADPHSLVLQVQGGDADE